MKSMIVALAVSLACAAVAADDLAGASSALHLQQRELLKSEIDFYVNKYEGAELASALQRCQAPVFPRGSESRDGIRKVEGEYQKWQECYNNFVTALNDAMRPDKLIPARLADIMDQQELTAALARMDQVHARLGAQARDLALPVLAQHDEWLARSAGLARLANQRVAWRQNAPSSLPCNGVPSRSC